MTQYDYTKAVVVIPRLWAEIIAANLSSATLKDIQYSAPDSLAIIFNQELSGDDETALGTVVSDHDGTPLPEYPKFCCRCGSFFVHLGLSEPTVCPFCGSDNIVVNPLAADCGICSKAIEGMRGFQLSRTLPPTEDYTVELGNFVKGSGSHTLIVGVSVCSANYAVSKIFFIAVGYNETGGNWREVIGLKSSGDFASNDFGLDVKVTQNTCYLRLRRKGGAQSGVHKVKILDVGYGDATWTETSETGSDTPPNYYQGTLLEARDGIIYAFGALDMQNKQIKNAGGIHKTGNYTGNGTSQSVDVGFQPKIVKIFRWNETYPNKAEKNDQMDGDDYLRTNSDGTPYIDFANGITLTETGFDLGSDSTINSDGNTYYWEAYG
jgi:hypothetical protein